MKTVHTKLYEKPFWSRDFESMQDEFDVEISINSCGSIDVHDYSKTSEMLCTEVLRAETSREFRNETDPRMMPSRASLPNEIDMSLMKLEIQSLNRREPSLEPYLRKPFHDQLKSAEEALEEICEEMEAPSLNSRPLSIELQKSIARHWRKLNSMLNLAKAFCA